MSDADVAAEDAAPPKKKSKLLLLALVFALLLGGGTFYGVYSGLVPLPFGNTADGEMAAKDGEKTAQPQGFAGGSVDVAFVPLDPMLLSLGPEARSRHLRVAMTIEVAPGAEAAVTSVSPRVVDVLNTFLRAVDETELESPRAMARLRAQMLRRVKLVTPPGSVRDLLIQEFVFN